MGAVLHTILPMPFLMDDMLQHVQCFNKISMHYDPSVPEARCLITLPPPALAGLGLHCSRLCPNLSSHPHAGTITHGILR